MSENWLNEYLDTLQAPKQYEEPKEEWLKSYLAETLTKQTDAPVDLAKAGALPALGTVGEEQPTTSPFSESIESLVRATMPDAAEETLANVFPQGALGNMIDTTVMSFAQPFVGVGEAVGMLPEGTTQEVVQDMDRDRVAIAAKSDLPGLQVALSGGAELAGGVMPGFGAAKGVMKAATVSGKSATEAAKLAAKYGVPSEAVLQGYFSSEGIPWEERWKVMALSSAIGAGGGILGVKDATRKAAKAAEVTPAPVRPPSVEQAEVLPDTIKTPQVVELDSIESIRSEANVLRNQEAADRFATAVTTGNMLDVGTGALTEIPIVYHGSGRKFDRFANHKIGTGEGAQAYMYGHYVTETPKIAKGYARPTSVIADKKTGTKINNAQDLFDLFNETFDDDISKIESDLADDLGIDRVDTKDVLSPFGYRAVEELVLTGKDTILNGSYKIGDEETAGVIQRLGRSSRFDPFTETAAYLSKESKIKKALEADGSVRKIDDALERLRTTLAERIEHLEHSEGITYKVKALPKTDELILWDKPFSEQSDKVKNAIRSISKEINLEFAFLEELPAERLVSEITGHIERKHSLKVSLGKKYGDIKAPVDVMVSNLFLERGVKGNKYLDGFSRKKGEGTYNYVIFDDKDLLPIEAETRRGDKINIVPSLLVEDLASKELTTPDVVASRTRAGAYAPMVPDLKRAEAVLARYENIVRNGGEPLSLSALDAAVDAGMKEIGKLQNHLSEGTLALQDVESRIEIETNLANDASLLARVNQATADAAHAFHLEKERILKNLDTEIDAVRKLGETELKKAKEFAEKHGGVAVAVGKDGQPLKSKFTQAEDIARARAEDLLIKAGQKYQETVDKITYSSPAARGLSDLISAREKIRSRIEFDSKAIQTLEGKIAAAEAELGLDGVIARGAALGMTPGETIIDMVDRSARENLAQSIADAAEAEAMKLLGVGRQDLLDMPVEKLVEMREKILRDIDVMQNSKPYAEQLWSRMREISSDDSSAVARLRNNAALAEIFRKEDAGFDQMDTWYRDKKYERNSLRPDTQGDSAPPRQAADSLSEYKDAATAVLNKIKIKAGDEYRRLFKAQSTDLLLPDGSIISKEDFVSNRVQATRKVINDAYTAALKSMGKQNEQTVIRTIDAVTDSLLRQNKIDKASVGFRGGSFENARQLRSEAGVWMDSVLEGRGLGSLSDGELVDIAKRARDERAPDVTFDWLIAEQERRRSKLPQTPRVPVSKSSPDTLVALADERIRLRTDPDTAKTLAGAKLVDRDKLSRTARAGRRVERWVRTMFAANRKLVSGKFLLYSVEKTTEDAVLELANRAARNELRQNLDKVMSGKHAVREQMGRIAAVADKDLTDAIGSYVARQNEMGNGITEAQFRQQLYEARVSGKVSEIADPEFQKFYTEVFEPFHRSMQEKASMLVSDPFEKAKVLHEIDRYLHRRYSIYSVKDAAYKKIDTTTEAYKRYMQRRMTEDYDVLRKEAYNNHSPELRGRGYTEDQIAELIDIFVENRIHGDIEKLVKQGLNLHEREFGKKVLGESDPDYLKERQVEDADLREILGEVKDIRYSAMSFAHGVAHDVSTFILRADLMKAFREAGMIHDKPISGYAIPISSATLKHIGDTGAYKAADGERILYASPGVVSVLDAVSRAGDDWERTVVRAVGRVKGGFVMTLRNGIQQVLGMYQMVVNSAGHRGVMQLLPWRLGTFLQAAKEVSLPGTTGVETQNIVTRFFGLKSKELSRALADEITKYGLDRANEYVHEIEMTSRPALVNPELKRGGALESYDKALLKLGHWWKIPDVAARTIAWVSRIQKVMDLEGIKTPTEQIKREAAIYAKNTTQDPDTTPAIVRDTGRSLGMAGFQSWGYQMLRNLTLTYAYSLKDMIRGMKYIGAGEAAKGGRWLAEGASQAAIVTAGTMFLFQAMTRRSDEEEKQAVAATDALWKNKRNARIALGSKIPGMEKPGFERRDGMIIMNYVDATGLDIHSTTKRAMVALARSYEQQDPQILAQEFMNQYAQPSFFLLATMDLMGLEQGKTTAVPGPRASLGYENKLFDIPVVGGTVTAQGIAKAAGRIMPGMARFATDVMIDPALRKIFGEGAGIRKLDPQDPVQDRAKMQLVSQFSGVQAFSVDYGKMLARRINEEYDANAIWFKQMKREWQAANTWDAQIKVVKKYEKDWDSFYKSMKLRVENGYATGAVNVMDMNRILSSKYGEDLFGKSKGYPIRPEINRGMQTSLLYGMDMDIKQYLFSLRKTD